MADGNGRPDVVRQPSDGSPSAHRRFPVDDVVVGGVATGGATVDTWNTDDGTGRWCARLLLDDSHPLGNGSFSGRLRDGGRVEGTVTRGRTVSAPKRGR